MERKVSSAKTKKSKKQGKRIPKLSNVVKPDGMTLEAWQVALRQQMAQTEALDIRYVDEKRCPGEYLVRNPKTKNRYKVVYRGARSEWNYCSCMDFKTSQLGTCKHIEAVKLWLSGRRRVHSEVPAYTSVYLSYTHGRQVCIRIGTEKHDEFARLALRYFDKQGVLRKRVYADFGTFLTEAKAISDSFRCYDDAIDYVLAARDRMHRDRIIRLYSDEQLDQILSVPLFPYQREGVRFAFKAGRAIIADEMGLGKTIQAICTAELMRREGLAGSVLVVCPTSLKYQWKREIERFTGGKASVRVVEGDHLKRMKQYYGDETYKIVSYNSLTNDIKIAGSVAADLVVMDEVQRLKNWNTQLSMACRKIESQYAVILSGTPLENKLEELYSIVEFADQFALAPYYTFRDRYIITNEAGRTIGYKNLNDISNRLAKVLIRRKKKDVALEMPQRTDTNIFVAMTKEQAGMHDEYRSVLARLIQKFNRYHFLTEQERQRMLVTLNKMRMVCDSSYILDQSTRYDTKVGELINILSSLLSSPDEKVVVFSQWERMTRLVAQELDKAGILYCNLNGSVASTKRGEMVNAFTDDPAMRVFLSTDAGSTGLNLQVASTIINIDLPWNPAVLEQRIARIYRIGQRNNIQVINLVSPSSIEEDMIGKLKFKSSMFAGALDNGDDAIYVNEDRFKNLAKFVEEMVSDKKEEPITVPNADLVAEEPIDKQTDAVEEIKSTDNPSDDSATANIPATDPLSEDTTIQAEPEADDVVATGIKFLTGLASTLKTEEGRTNLINRLVKTDETTGTTSINIPVADKQTVKQLFDVIGKLLG